jgi:murein DD-endopeptidase MepM/ murein hydrolase activator NlpD
LNTRPLIAVLFALGCARAAATTPTPVNLPPDVTDADVEYFTAHPLMVPVDGVTPEQVPDTYHEPRGEGRIHSATDILAPRETAVIAAIAGRVIRLRQNSLGGITAYLIDQEERYVYYYAHMAYYSTNVTEGLEVGQGFVIGYVGTTGNAPPDTPHLHFQAMRLDLGLRDWSNGTPVDVRPFMKKKGKALQ